MIPLPDVAPDFFNHINNPIPKNQSDPGNVIQSTYFEINELQFKTPKKEKSLFLFHVSSSSLNKILKKKLFQKFRMPKKFSVTQNFVLNDYSFEHTRAESSAGEILLRIAIHLHMKFAVI